MGRQIFIYNISFRLNGHVPWIAIFDKDISISAQQGYYIVFLFPKDFSGVYISLNQGWIYYENLYGRNAKMRLEMVTNHWKDKMKVYNKYFSYGEIDLKSKAAMPLGYEKGNICSVFYPRKNIPSNKVILDDINRMIVNLEFIKSNFIQSSFTDTNTNIISNKLIAKTADRDWYDQSKFDEFDNIIASKGVDTILNVNNKCLEITNNEYNLSKNGIKKKEINRSEQNQKRTKLGLAGELVVLNFEREKLKKLGIDKKVRHVSVEDGDFEGYDILSYDEHGNEMYIEVKSTTKGSDTPFFITDNEVKFSLKHEDCYYLYRVYNLKPQGVADVSIIKGNVAVIFNLEPISYKVIEVKKSRLEGGQEC